jgi:hypothetical protein
MRELTIQETELVGGGLLDISTGSVNALNNLSLVNDNVILSGNKVSVSDNLSGNSVDVDATVKAVLGSLGL